MFLTQLDPRAEVKGSRDPLGLQALWSHLGRGVVGNLTTVTQSLRDFMTLLFGFHFAQQAIDAGRGKEEDRCALFLEFEQLAAYSLYASGATEDGGGPMRGINRVRARLDSEERVRISADPHHQILSNQKIYGLWGLYSVAARDSGWTEQEEQRLNPATAQFAERLWWHVLGRQARSTAESIIGLLHREAWFHPKGRDAAVARALSRALSEPLTGEFQRFFEDSLVRNHLGTGSTLGRQALLWTTMEQAHGRRTRDWARAFDRQELVKLLALSADQPLLHGPLENISRAEQVLAPAGRLFQFLLTKDRRTVESVEADLRQHWGPGLPHLKNTQLRELEGLMTEAVGAEAAGRVVAMQEALGSGAYTDFCAVAAQHNAEVMKERGGAPWLEVEGRKLKVRIKAETALLPEADELPDLWINSYFLHSLKRIGAQVTGKLS